MGKVGGSSKSLHLLQLLHVSLNLSAQIIGVPKPPKIPSFSWSAAYRIVAELMTRCCEALVLLSSTEQTASPSTTLAGVVISLQV